MLMRMRRNSTGNFDPICFVSRTFTNVTNVKEEEVIPKIDSVPYFLGQVNYIGRESSLGVQVRMKGNLILLIEFK